MPTNNNRLSAFEFYLLLRSIISLIAHHIMSVCLRGWRRRRRFEYEEGVDFIVANAL